MTKPEILAKLRSSHNLFQPDKAHRLDIDVAELAAQEAAAIIVAHLKQVA